MRPAQRFAVIYILGIAAAFVVNYPGRATPDVIDMLSQARDVGKINDWHSPAITFFYGFLGPILGYPAGGLLLQSIVLLAWPSRVLADICHSGPLHMRAAVAPGLWSLVCIAFVALAGEINKDVALASLLSLILFILHGKEQDRDILGCFSSGRWVALAACAAGLVMGRSVNVLSLATTAGALVI